MGHPVCSSVTSNEFWYFFVPLVHYYLYRNHATSLTTCDGQNRSQLPSSLERPRLHLCALDGGARVLEPVDDVVDVERLATPPRLQRIQLPHITLDLRRAQTINFMK